MKRVNTLAAILLTLMVSSALAQDTLWTRTYGGSRDEVARSIYPTSDGGSVIAGVSNSADRDGTDFYLIKTDADGEIDWSQSYGNDSNEDAHSVIQASDGGYIMAGNSQQYGRAINEIYLVKTNALGHLEWDRTYTPGEQSHLGLSACSILELGDGGYLIAGSAIQFGPVYGRFVLIRTDSSGDSLWSRTYAGSNFGAWASCLIETTDGNFIISGRNGFESYLTKISDDGDVLWYQSYLLGSRSIASSIAQADDGGFIIAGTFLYSGEVQSDIYIMKTDENGNAWWTGPFGGVEDDSAYAISQASDGSYLIAGTTNSFGDGRSNVYLVRADENGGLLSTRTYGGVNDDGVSSMYRTNDGDFMVAGYTASFGAGSFDCWVLKIDGELTGIEDDNDETLPNIISLSQNYPNPFNASTIIEFELNQPGYAGLDVFDVRGRKVKTLVDDYLGSGRYTVKWNGISESGKVVTSGSYFYKLKSGDYIDTRKMVLIK
ncbi:MAG: T9SS type A sorting domain-containing protein [candidate division Zixibacteria bacterium]|nr:T9SS type A sorting domain-containing protein [candidate division Zixibacteria bacterium]